MFAHFGILPHNTCLLLLQNQVIFVRHFNDTVVWTSTSRVRSKSLSSIITANLYVIAVSEHLAESYGFSLGTSVLLTGWSWDKHSEGSEKIVLSII